MNVTIHADTTDAIRMIEGLRDAGFSDDVDIVVFPQHTTRAHLSDMAADRILDRIFRGDEPEDSGECEPVREARCPGEPFVFHGDSPIPADCRAHVNIDGRGYDFWLEPRDGMVVLHGHCPAADGPVEYQILSIDRDGIHPVAYNTIGHIQTSGDMSDGLYITTPVTGYP